RQTLVVAGLVALGPPLVILYVRYQLSRFLGAVIDANLLLALAGGSPVEWFAQAIGQLVPLALAIGAALLASALLIFTLRDRGSREASDGMRAPSFRELLLAFAVTFAVGGGVLIAARYRGGIDYDTLAIKTSGAAMAAVFEQLTDFDRDGYGLFTRPI